MEYNIQNTISYTDFFLYFSSIHILQDYNEEDEYIEQSELESYWSYNELISDKFYVNSDFSYINLINYRKLLHSLYYNSNITLEEMYDLRYFLIDLKDDRFIYSAIENTDKYYETPMKYLNCYYVKRSGRFENICKIKPEYKKLISDIKKHFEDYLIELNYMRSLFSPMSIIFNLAKNYTYEETLKIILNRMKLDNAVVSIEQITNGITHIYSYSKSFQDKDKIKIIKNEIKKFNELKYNNQGEVTFCRENSSYLSWITNNKCNEFNLPEEDIDIDSISYTIDNNTLINVHRSPEKHIRLMQIYMNKSASGSDILFFRTELKYFRDFLGDFFRQSILNENYKIIDIIRNEGYNPNMDIANETFVINIMKDQKIDIIFKLLQYRYKLNFLLKSKYIFLCETSLDFSSPNYDSIQILIKRFKNELPLNLRAEKIYKLKNNIARTIK